jgi:P27 family predicted phage terminase small subunit
MPGTASSGGRNRKSRAQHTLAGTGRKDRGTAPTSTSADAPDPPTGRPATPKTLKGDALAEWTRMVRRLELAKTLSVVDDGVLYRYCQLHARAERLEGQIAKLRSAFYRDHLNNPKVHPAFAQLRAYDQALRGYLVEFGMTPAARSRVKVTAPPAPATDPTDPFAEFDEPTATH